MAQQTKASRQAAARKRAYELAEDRRKREDQLLEHAESYFMAQGEIEDIQAALDQKIAELRAKADRDTAAVRTRADEQIVKMLSTGEPRSGVAERLGLSVSTVRKTEKATTPDNDVKPARSAAEPGSDGSGEAGGETPNDAADSEQAA
ncbi:hypothetical protein ACX80B_17530 [Arthrobacter monumenti]